MFISNVVVLALLFTMSMLICGLIFMSLSFSTSILTIGSSSGVCISTPKLGGTMSIPMSSFKMSVIMS